MAEFFDVQYNINVVSQPAVTAINSFVRATEQLTKATGNLMKFKESLAQLETLGTTKIPLRIDASQALKKLQQVENKINEIKNRAASSIKINVTGGVTGSGGKGTAKTRNVVTPAPTQSRQRLPKPQPIPQPIKTAKQQQPIQGAGGRMRPGIIPSNLRYEVLGPTRIGNVAMLDMFKGMGLMYGISAIGSGVRDILSTSAEYQNVMQTAKNILKTNYKGGGFEANFAEMERIARQVGVETKFTAPEVADAVKFLAMAGLDINAISKSIRPIADIALIGDTDLGTTADVMTNIMTAYGIKPEDMRKTADVMTRTFTMSNTTLMELAESFKMAGSMLHLANVPFETAAAAFGVLGDAGIKATMAGTTMRTIMNNLRNPTKGQKSYWETLGIRRFDEFGNLREINEIFADLNRLNGSDERSKEAKRRYEELQKKYEPKLDGLTEGSAEYNKVLAQYDQESEAIRRQFGGVDVFRLFRLTAASGAGVLMSQVEKWNKIIEENFLSDGLSQKLADEKKNQIVGLWAQLKSAFQEQGLQIFEENEGKLRSYLDSAINWVKSAEFKNILKSIIDLVETLANQLKKFTGWVITLYDRFKPLVKLFLTFQLPLKMMTTVLGSALQVFYSFAYSLSPFARALTSATFLQRRTGLYGYVNTYGAAGMQAAGGQAAQTYGLGPMLGWYASRKNPEMYTRLMENGGNAKMAMRMDPRYNMMNTSANLPLYKQYKELEKRNNYANRLQARGMAFGIGGFLAGSYFGSAVAPESDWAPVIGGAAGSLGAVALSASSIPYAGWIAAAVIAAAAGTAWIIKYTRECREARAAVDEWADSLGKLDVQSMRIDNATDYFIASARIRMAYIDDETRKINEQTIAWKKWYNAMNGVQDEEPSSKDYMLNVPGFKELSNQFKESPKTTRNEIQEKLKENGLYESLNNEARSLFGRTAREYSFGDLLDFAWRNEYGNATTQEFLDPLATVNGVYLASQAQNYFGNLPNGFIYDFQNALANITDESEINAAINGLRNKYLKPAGDFFSYTEEANADYEALSGIHELNKLLRYPTYYTTFKHFFDEKINELTTDAQNKLQDPSIVWKNAVSELFPGISNPEDFFGFTKTSVDQWIAGLGPEYKEKALQTAFQGFVEKFNNASSFDRLQLLPLLNRKIWEDFGADLQNISGGFYPYLENDHPYGEDVEWNSEKGYFLKNGIPYDPTSNWIYKPHQLLNNELRIPFIDPQWNSNEFQFQNSPLYYPSGLSYYQTDQDGFRPSGRTQTARAENHYHISLHFDNAVRIENMNGSDLTSEEGATFIAQVVRDTIGNAVETFNPNELTV